MSDVKAVKTIKHMMKSYYFSRIYICKIKLVWCVFFFFCGGALALYLVTDRSKSITILLSYSNKWTVNGLRAQAFPFPQTHRVSTTAEVDNTKFK